MMLVGWMRARTRSFARLSSSAARMTTDVVPSPTSWSCRSASSTRIWVVRVRCVCVCARVRCACAGVGGA
jgi:hypothetical protein